MSIIFFHKQTTRLVSPLDADRKTLHTPNQPPYTTF